MAAAGAAAARLVADGQTIGLGSGRAAAAFARALGARAAGGLSVTAVPTSMQIRLVAEECGVPLADSVGPGGVDAVFDGADQIDARGYMIKGGGGALLRENILISSARRVFVIADASKFVPRLSAPVPVEVHPFARATAARTIGRLGGEPSLRRLARGYPFVTEAGNLILDCGFGRIDSPPALSRRLAAVAGVVEVGVFLRRPDVAYRAGRGGGFREVRFGGRAPAR